MTTSLLWSHETRFTPVTTSASEARTFVCLHLVEHHLPYLVEDIRLVVSELVTNSVLHARTALTVRIQAMPACVMLTVHDESSSAPVTGVARVDATGGRGMDVVEQCSSDWGVSPGIRGDKSVWASFAVRPVPMGADQATS
jgi:hypothetical protein